MSSPVQLDTGSVAAMDVDAAAHSAHPPAAANAPISSDSAAATLQSDTQPTLDKIPDDVLLQIWVLLEQPEKLAEVSKRFRIVSKDAFFQTKWLLNRYQLYEVLFEAIARPRLFSAEIFNRLRQAGAVLSRNLVQLLHLLHNPWTLTGQTKTRWGRISFKAYCAVMVEAEKLYGQNIKFEHGALDSFTFSIWLRSWEEDEAIPPYVRELFESASFTPLPLTFMYSTGSGGRALAVHQSKPLLTDLLHAFVKVPDLVPLARANGYAFDPADSLYMCRQVFISTVRSSDQIFGALCRLQEYGVLRVSRTAASNVIASMRGSLKSCGSHYHVEHPHLAGYEALLQLENEGRLAFSLEHVVEKVLEPWSSGAVDSTMIVLLERINKDLPQVAVRTLFIAAMFLKAEDKGITHLGMIQDWLGRHADKVCSYDILQACLRNKCTSTIAIEYAMQYLADFDLSAFVQELLDAILSQPYRGIMLRKLHDFFSSRKDDSESSSAVSASIDFKKLLAEAVEAQAFDHAQLPPQEWHDSANGYGPKVRSLLAYSLREANAKGLNSDRFPLPSEDEVTPYLSNFTRFGYKHTEIALSRQRASTVKTAGADQDNGSIGAIEHITLGEALYPREEERKKPTESEKRRDSLKKERLNNIFGPRDRENEQHVAHVIVELLGPDSQAANHVLSHAFVNGNAQLSEKLINDGVCVTLDHLKIALQLGYPLPRQMTGYFKLGAPFKAHFDSQDEPDELFLAQKKGKAAARLSKNELRECEKIASVEDDSSGYFSVEVEESGALRIVHFDSSDRPSVVEDISTSSRSLADACKDVEMSDASSLSSLSSCANSDDEAVIADPDASIAERAKKLRRRKVRISYADDDDSASDVEADDELEPAWSGVESKNDQLIAQLDDVSVAMTRAERDQRLHSAELWLSHLLVLRHHYDRRHAAIKACRKPGLSAVRRSDAHITLADNVIPALRFTITALKSATRATPKTHNMELLDELNELSMEHDDICNNGLPSVQAEQHGDNRVENVARLIKRDTYDAAGVRRYVHKTLQQRLAFKNQRNSFTRAVETANIQRREGAHARIVDQDSDDENFSPPLDQSDNDEDSDSSSDSSVGEPASKRAKTGADSSTDTASRSTKGTSRIEKMLSSLRAKGLHHNEQDSDELSSSDESTDEEEEEVEQAAESYNGANEASGSAAPANLSSIEQSPGIKNLKKKAKHPVYSHPFFIRAEFNKIWDDLKADGGTSKRIMEDSYLEQLEQIEDEFDEQEAQCEHDWREEGVFA